MKKVFLILSFIVVNMSSFTQTIQWQKCFGGTGDDYAYNVQQTTDGGYIVAGGTSSNDGDVTGNHGGYDYWVVKTDSYGTIQWQKCFGGSAGDFAASVQQTTDGGYIVAGGTSSNDGDVTGNHGNSDYWVIKTNSSGTIQWQKCFGGSAEDIAESVLQTKDGGYIIAGNSRSHDGDVTGNHGDYDYWVVKTDSSGAIQWQKCFGGSAEDIAESVQQTTDGGYIIVGNSRSNDGDVTGNHGGYDYWVVKTDQFGIIQWQKCFGGSDTETAYNVQQTTDGGYIIAGLSDSNDGDVTSNHGGLDYWVVKTDSYGTIQWQKCFGGSSNDYAHSIQQTTDECYVIAGVTNSNDGDVTGNHGEGDYWVVKTDSSKTIHWQKCFGGTDFDYGFSVQQTGGGSFIIVGSSYSNDGDVTGNQGGLDYWVVKLCLNDPLSITISDSTYCYSTLLSATDGFTSYLWSTGETTQIIEVIKGGIYSVKATNASGCPSESEIFVPGTIQPYGEEQICMVSVDELKVKNVIVIEKTLNVGIDSILIYRMNNQTSQYQKIGSTSINDLGIFNDIDAIPAQQSYQYRISVKDTCGRESGLSGVHHTILLQANTGINREVNLFWNPYEGFNYSNFQIYRSNDSGAFILIGSVPNNTYAFTDLTPPSGLKKYHVRISKAVPCDPIESIYGYVSSNVVDINPYGIEKNQAKSFRIFPNPALGTFILELTGLNKSEQTLIEIYGIWGEKVLTETLYGESRHEFSLYDRPVGVYFIRVVTGDKSETVKIIKQ